MPVIQQDAGYYAVDWDPNSDMRYGSQLVQTDFAFPSWYGPHGNSGLFGTGVLIDGQTVSYATLFATQPWVYVAVQRLLTWASRVPLKVYRRTGDDSRERLRPGEHPLATAIGTPWPRGASVQLVMEFLGPLLVHGNATVQVESGRGGSIQFKPRDWRYMRMLRFKDEPSKIRGWETDQDGSVVTLTEAEVLHTKWWSPLGPAGLSPLASLGVTLAVEDAALRYSRSNLLNMARPPSAITISEQWLDLDRGKRDEVIQQLRTQISDIYSGPENAGKVAILPTGLDWKGIGHTAQEAQLIDVRKVARNEIAAAYMVPPPMIGQLDEATYSNIETQREMAYTDGLAPPLTLIEQIINAQLVKALMGVDDVFVEFDFAGILRGDRLKEIQALREAIGTGLLSINEGRTVLNYPHSEEEDADKLWMPTNNMATVGTDTTSTTDTSVAANATETAPAGE
jgi:HK97 family phage portal protein